MGLLYFASSNTNKYYEIQSLIQQKRSQEIDIQFKKIDFTEIQSDKLFDVAADKVLQAFNIIKDKVFVEDDGLFIRSLNGFPGVYSSYVHKTLGNKGILDLLSNKDDRISTFQSIISFYDGKEIKSFTGEIMGKITNSTTDGGWGFDPIFIPEGTDITFGQMNNSDKNKLSHRKIAFDKFYEWYIEYQQI